MTMPFLRKRTRIKNPDIPLYTDVPPKKRLGRLLNFARSFGFDECFCDDRGLLPVFSFIRMLSDRLYSERVVEVISRDGISTDFQIGYLLKYFQEDDPVFCKPVTGTADIDLAIHPAICNVWQDYRLICAFNNTATAGNPWQYHKPNHLARLYLPFGLTAVYNGNHSSAAGILKKEGILHIPEGSILDLSPMYDSFRFDGENYLDNDGKIAFAANSFEFGVIYEIGRIIHSKGVRFLGIDF